MTPKSPFTLHRFEHQQEQLYFLPQEPFALLEQAKSLFLIGSRGTGKTTFLQALNWREQLSNMALQEHLAGSILERRYIGVYVKTPLMHVPAFDKWLDHSTPELQDSLFSTYLDLVWLEELANAIAQLLDLGILRARPKQEASLVHEILQRESSLRERRTSVPVTLLQLSRFLYTVRRELENLAIVDAESTPKELSGLFPISQIGGFGRSICRLLGDFCTKYSGDTDHRPWYFRICLDESECLSVRQQKVLNMMIRLSEAPLSYVVSYVRPAEDMTTTCLPNLTPQNADRNILRLDAMSDTDFRELCIGVARSDLPILRSIP